MDNSAEVKPKKERIFEDIDAEQRVTEIESLCMNCHENDLNRQLVKAETASVKLVELDFEIPSTTQRGVLTTVEGLIQKAAAGLAELQPQRKLIDEDIYNKIESVIAQLEAYTNDPASNPFTIILDDPAGNSYIENLCAPSKDPQMTIHYYKRTPEMNEAIGLPADEVVQTEDAPMEKGGAQEQLEDTLANDVHVFHGNCSRCNAPSDTRMHLIEIPYFKEVVIMATDCDTCGYKSNEVKAGGAISPQGKRITLRVLDREDLSRDVLKSETCGLTIPEIELELTTGTLGGRFTTVEGLLSQVCEELEQKSPFATGDASDTKRRLAFEKFIAKLRKAIAVEEPYTLILDDPLANSYLQNPYAPDPDPEMTIEMYDRTYDQNEDLGLNDMIVEGYEQNN
ncbi:hypothetical protein HDV05_007653 [Chytridiales sp. JEL 0842]|nr:hypothetical protein HDV05_007653 [Chytridiales sp. JEL 0842]